MIKLGVTRLEQLRQRRIQTLMGGTRYVSLRLLEELGTIPESEANQLFPVVTKRLTNSAGAFRRTDPERFDTLNAELMNFLAAHRDRVGGLRVHDAAVADGTTALALYRSFLEAGIQLDSYLATDLCDYVVQIDRGGQVTYHGPGQWVAYVLYDLRRANVNVRQLVNLLEAALVQVLGDWGIEAYGDPDARGVYVDGCKIAAWGLKVSKGRSYHGLSLNVDLDLSPFSGINPCGYEGLEVTSIATLMGSDCPDMDDVGEALLRHLEALLPAAD